MITDEYINKLFNSTTLARRLMNMLIKSARYLQKRYVIKLMSIEYNTRMSKKIRKKVCQEQQSMLRAKI